MTAADTTHSVDQLRAEVERTREELSETIDELAHRLDVKARARRRVQGMRESFTRDPRRAVVGVAVLGGAAALLIWRKTR